jgi:hypothetical protein
VNKKISNIRRFLSLLLTDKDPGENDSSIVSEEVIPDFLYEDNKTHLRVTPDDI